MHRKVRGWHGASGWPGGRQTQGSGITEPGKRETPAGENQCAIRKGSWGETGSGRCPAPLGKRNRSSRYREGERAQGYAPPQSRTAVDQNLNQKLRTQPTKVEQQERVRRTVLHCSLGLALPNPEGRPLHRRDPCRTQQTAQTPCAVTRPCHSLPGQRGPQGRAGPSGEKRAPRVAQQEPARKYGKR